MPYRANQTEDRPQAPSTGPWRIFQQWNDMIFAHWPVEAEGLGRLLPQGLELDLLHGTAWLTVMAFRRASVRYAPLPPLPLFQNQPEINLQLCVRETGSDRRGSLLLSKDAAHPFSFLATRCIYRIPSYWSEMYFERRSAQSFSIYSRRRFGKETVFFRGRYRSMGAGFQIGTARQGSLEEFLMERYQMYLGEAGALPIRYQLRHQPWVIERAEAELERNDLAKTLGIQLAEQPACMHFVPRIQVAIGRGIRLTPPAAAPAAERIA